MSVRPVGEGAWPRSVLAALVCGSGEGSPVLRAPSADLHVDMVIVILWGRRAQIPERLTHLPRVTDPTPLAREPRSDLPCALSGVTVFCHSQSRTASLLLSPPVTPRAGPPENTPSGSETFQAGCRPVPTGPRAHAWVSCLLPPV